MATRKPRLTEKVASKLLTAVIRRGHADEQAAALAGDWHAFVASEFDLTPAQRAHLRTIPPARQR